MASSGSFSTNSYNGRYLVFSWSETSQSVANNQTTISWKLTGAGHASTSSSDYNQYYKSGNFKVVIDGKTVYSTGEDDRIKLYDGTVVKSGTYTFTHNADGTKSFTASAQGAIYYYEVNCRGSGTFTLDKIARNPTAPTSFSISAGYGKYVGLGDTINLSWSGATGNITGYELQYQRGTSGWNTWKTQTGTSTTDSFTDPNLNRSGITVEYRVRALNGSLASPWKESNELILTGGMDLKVSNSWRTGSVWIKVNGTWKRAKRVWIKVNGNWQYSK